MKLSHTKDEHRAAIAAIANAHIQNGMSAEDAIAKAGEEWRAKLRADGDKAIAGVLDFLHKR